MALTRLDARDGVEAEAVAEPVEQRRDIVCGWFRLAAGQFGLLRFEFFGGEDGEDHVLDSEAGVDRIEFCGEQFGEMARVAARPGGAEPDVLDAAVDSVKAESEPARAHPFARQSRREILGQALDRAGEIGGIGDRLGKAQPHPPARGFAER